MRVKVREIGQGLHPSEVVVEVKTSLGPQNLVIDRRALDASSLSVGAPLRLSDNMYLVELPRETMNGAWRVWVPQSQLKPEPRAKVA